MSTPERNPERRPLPSADAWVAGGLVTLLAVGLLVLTIVVIWQVVVTGALP